MYAVTGSTGQVGTATVKALRQDGKQVRALLRNPNKSSSMESLGAVPFTASVEDASALEAAFQDVEAVFVMTPPLYYAPDPRSEHKVALAALKHALQAAHVGRIVLLSSIGAQHDTGTGVILKLHDMETEMFELSANVAAIRAAYFMENLIPSYGQVKQTGELKVFQEHLDQPIPMVATSDIGSAAADLLKGGWSGHRIIELEGPRSYSMRQVGEVFASLLQRNVTVTTVPVAEQQGMFRKMGLSEGAAHDMEAMARAMDSGQIAFAGGERVSHLQGSTPLEDVYRGR